MPATHFLFASILPTMHSSGLVGLVALLGSALSAPAFNLPQNSSALATLQKQALGALKAAEGNSTNPNGCSVSNAAVRKDWYAFLFCCFGTEKTLRMVTSLTTEIGQGCAQRRREEGIYRRSAVSAEVAVQG